MRDQLDPGLFRGLAALLAITQMAAADYIFPARAPPLGARDDMIQVEIDAGEFFSAILTGILIAGKNIVAAEADAALRNPIVSREQNDPGDLEGAIHQPNGFIIPFDA